MVAFNQIATVLFVLSVGGASAVSTFLELPANQTVVEGGDATLSCNATVNGARQPLSYRIGNGVGSTLQSAGGNITDLSLVDGVVGACVFGEYRTQLILKGVTRQADGYTVTCTVQDGLFFVAPQDEPPAFLSVIYPPVYSFLPNQPTTVLEKGGFTYSFGFDAKPAPTNFTWSRDGQVISSGGRIATSVSTITITSTARSDSGVYEVVSYNEAGRGAGNFTLDVQYPPEYANTTPVQLTQLMVGAPFTLNCTPSAANPPVDTVSIEVEGSTVTSGDTVTVTDNVLIIPSVQRIHSGNYSCNATNTRGSAVIFDNLLVVVPPGRPENLAFPSIGPYSVTVTWDPPSDDGGTPDPLNYLVALTTTSDGQSVSANQTTQTQLTFTALSHSENYTVSVVAVNSLGQQGPSGVGTVRTRDIPPVIGTVATKVLSLSDIQVTVTLSDNGGQPVEEYTVTINGTVVTFVISGSADLHFIGNVTGLSLMNGVTYTVSVVARNSIGASETFTGMVFVPFPPNITMQPVAVTPDETTTRCCAGVRVFLEHPSDPTLVFTAQVSTEGSPFTAHNVTREGDVVYVQGLQAGMPYNIRLTGRNQFGSVMANVTTTPLIGSPSDPSMPVVSVEGSSVSIQLNTRYPGTNARGQFRFSLIFSAASTAKRQSLQPTEVRVDPTGLDSSVTTTHTLTDVAAGSYSVSVMAENENGMSQDVTATFVVEDMSPPDTTGSDGQNTVVIIGVVAAVVVVILLIIITLLGTVLVCVKYKTTILIRCCKSRSSHDDVKVELKGVHSHFEDAKLELNPVYEEVAPLQALSEPQPYEEFVAKGGVTSDSVAIEENPAYQLAEPPEYECMVGVTKRPDVQTEEDPAYQPVDATEHQPEEPVYV